jgi:hypothetical protein
VAEVSQDSLERASAARWPGMLRYSDHIADAPPKILAQACAMGVEGSCASAPRRRIAQGVADPD